VQPITGTPARRAAPTSVPASPTMIEAPTSPPARAMVWRRIAGSGLATPNVSAPQIAAKREDRPSWSSSRFDSHSSLLVQTANWQPREASSSSAASSPSNGRDSTAMFSAFEQLARAVPDHLARRRQRQRPQTFALQDVIERADEVRRRVDQGAVEIEDDGAGDAHRYPLAAGLRPCKGPATAFCPVS
jgi:hypothetical protein